MNYGQMVLDQLEGSQLMNRALHKYDPFLDRDNKAVCLGQVERDIVAHAHRERMWQDQSFGDCVRGLD